MRKRPDPPRLAAAALFGVVFLLTGPAARAQKTRVADLAGNAGTTISGIEIEKIPSGRDPWTILRTTPGVVVDPSGAGGEPAADPARNSFIVDGIVVGPRGGSGFSTEDLAGLGEFVQEVRTGSEAEYGGALGGVLNVITRTGRNEFSGSLFAYGFDTPTEFPTSGGIGFDLRDEGGPACLDRAFFIDEKGAPIPGSRVPPAAGYTFGLDAPIRFTARGEGTRVDVDGDGIAESRIVIVPSCGGGPDLSLVDLDFSLRAPTHLFVGANGVHPVDLGAILPGTGKERVQTTWNASGPADLWKIEDTHVFSSDFYLTGLYSYVDGGFRRDPNGGIPPVGIGPGQGIGLLGADRPSGGGPAAGSPGQAPGVDVDGDGIPDSFFIQIQDLESDCPNLMDAFLMLARKGDGGGTLAPDPAARGIDCEGTASPFVNDRWRLNDRWSFNLGVRYEIAPPAEPPPRLDFDPAGAFGPTGARTGGSLDEGYDFGASLGGPLIRDKLWFFGAYEIHEPSERASPGRPTPDLFAGGRLTAREYTLGPVLDAPLAPDVQGMGVELRSSVPRESRAPGAGSEVPGGALEGDDPLPLLHFVSLGGSTGEVFEVEIVHPAGGAVPVEGFVAVEAVRSTPADRARFEEALARVGGERERVTAAGYCLQFAARAPAAGTVFRMAGPEKQRAFAPKARALEAARRLHDAGLLHPDTDPGSYFHSIRQWAMWTMEKEFDADGFVDAFLEHTKKNVEAAGQAWSEKVEEIVRTSARRRWEDVSRVLEEAGR